VAVREEIAEILMRMAQFGSKMRLGEQFPHPIAIYSSSLRFILMFFYLAKCRIFKDLTAKISTTIA
jgi:hypothetical protein